MKKAPILAGAFVLPFLLSLVVSAQEPPKPWAPLALKTPPLAGVKLFQLEQKGDEPLRAFLVIADLKTKGLSARPIRSTTPEGKEQLTKLAKTAGARVAVNFSYFRMKAKPCTLVGWMALDGEELSPPTSFQGPKEKRTPLARAALWWRKDDALLLGWVRREKKTLWRYSTPDLKRAQRKRLRLPRHALSAGPMLLRKGKTCITRVEEQLFAGRDDRHPRTALGLDGSKLFLLVADGRCKESRGLNLAELSALMKSVGAKDAMNLDGGGSSTLVVDGVLINSPCGGRWQRPVPNGLGLFVKKPVDQKR